MHLPDDLFHSNIYTVTSLRKKVVLNDEEYQSQKADVLKLMEKEQKQKDEQKQNDQQKPHEPQEQSASNELMLSGTTTISEFVLVYHAALIEGSLSEIMKIDNKSFYCNGNQGSCSTVFIENEKYCTVDMKSMKYKPCISTVDICKNAEKFFKLYDGHKSKPTWDFKTLYCLIFRTLDLGKLYPKTPFRCNPTHKYQFIKYIITKYITIRAGQISKKITLERQGALIREQYKRLVNFKGQ